MSLPTNIIAKYVIIDGILHKDINAMITIFACEYEAKIISELIKQTKRRKIYNIKKDDETIEIFKSLSESISDRGKEYIKTNHHIQKNDTLCTRTDANMVLRINEHVVELGPSNQDQNGILIK